MRWSTRPHSTVHSALINNLIDIKNYNFVNQIRALMLPNYKIIILSIKRALMLYNYDQIIKKVKDNFYSLYFKLFGQNRPLFASARNDPLYAD